MRMTDDLMPWLGDIHNCVPGYGAGVIVTVASVLCGAVIGFERERAQKPADMRTLVLICLGSAIFTQASILIGGVDRGRIAAQVVSGIGFLGAGAIIRERGLVIGVTTGAAIWATAAVGVVLGTGYVVAGAVFSLLIVGTLAGAKAISKVITGACRYQTTLVTFDPDNGKTRHLIQGLLDEHLNDKRIEYGEQDSGLATARIESCVTHREHRGFLNELAAMPQVKSMSPLPSVASDSRRS